MPAPLVRASEMIFDANGWRCEFFKELERSVCGVVIITRNSSFRCRCFKGGGQVEVMVQFPSRVIALSPEAFYSRLTNRQVFEWVF